MIIIDNKLELMCNDFIKNRDILRKDFTWENPHIISNSSIMFLDSGKKLDENRFIECDKIIKENTSGFSNFRGMVKMPFITSMALSTDPLEKLNKSSAIYEILKKYFSGSQYIALGAIMLADIVDPNNYEQVACRAKSIYTQIRKIHPFLTSSEDITFCLLLASSDMSEERILEETERCYNLLKPKFSSANAVQALSHVLTLLEGTPEEKSQNTISLFNKLKEKGYKYGTGFEIPTLGLLANLGNQGDNNITQDELINKFEEVDTYLSNQKGYSGVFGVSKQQRYMHVSMILNKYYNADNIGDISLLNSTLAIVIAEQIAIMTSIIVCATVVSNN